MTFGREDIRLFALMAVLAAVLLIMLIVSRPGALVWAIFSGLVVYRYEKPRSKI
jgi:hypothetical protein